MVIRFLSSIFTFVNKFVNEPKPASMKHLWKYIAGALAFALPVASCSDDNTSDFPDKEWGELTAPVLTVSEEEITLDANKADQEALKFSWTAASVVTRSSSVEYDLYLNIEGEDLFKGIKREWGGEAGLTISFTHEELNDLIITTFGGKSGERFAFRACVYAHTDNYLIEDKTSEEVAFAATAYAAEVVKPASLWMKGGACEYGWDKAIELPQGDEGVYTAENVVTKASNFTSRRMAAIRSTGKRSTANSVRSRPSPSPTTGIRSSIPCSTTTRAASTPYTSTSIPCCSR